MIGPDENGINTLRMQNARYTNCVRSSLNSFRGNLFKNVFYLLLSKSFYWPQRRATECFSFDFCIHEFTFRVFFSICVLKFVSFVSIALNASECGSKNSLCPSKFHFNGFSLFFSFHSSSLSVVFGKFSTWISLTHKCRDVTHNSQRSRQKFVGITSKTLHIACRRWKTEATHFRFFVNFVET